MSEEIEGYKKMRTEQEAVIEKLRPDVENLTPLNFTLQEKLENQKVLAVQERIFMMQKKSVIKSK